MNVMSTTEAEYIAIAECFKEAKWLKDLIGELCPSLGLVCLYCDSQKIHLVRNQNTFHSESNTFIKYKFIRDKIESKKLTLFKIAKEDNPSDMMTNHYHMPSLVYV